MESHYHWRQRLHLQQYIVHLTVFRHNFTCCFFLPYLFHRIRFQVTKAPLRDFTAPTSRNSPRSSADMRAVSYGLYLIYSSFRYPLDGLIPFPVS